MAGILPNEGETLVAKLLFKNGDVDRGTGLQLGLFTNSTPSETTAMSAITEPTGGSYARIELTDGSWTVTNDTATYATQTFTATGSAYSGTIYGYFICTKGTTPRLIDLFIEPVSFTMLENDTYAITPSIVVA